MKIFLDFLVIARNFMILHNWWIIVLAGVIMGVGISSIADSMVRRAEKQAERKATARAKLILVVLVVLITVALFSLVALKGYGAAIAVMIALVLLSLFIGDIVNLSVPIISIGMIAYIKAVVAISTSGKLFGWSMLLPIVLTMLGLAFSYYREATDVTEDEMEVAQAEMEAAMTNFTEEPQPEDKLEPEVKYENEDENVDAADDADNAKTADENV